MEQDIMYLANVQFALYEGGTVTQEQIEAFPPKEHFRHTYHTFKEPCELSVWKNSVIIAPAGKFSSAELLAASGGDQPRLILYGETPATLSEEDLAPVYTYWVRPDIPHMLKYYMESLLKRLEGEMDAWFTSHCLDQTINTLPDLIWYKDHKDAHLKVNDAFCKIVGKERSDIEGRGHYYIWGLTKEEYEKGEFVCLETEEEVFQKQETCLFDEEVMGQNGLRKLKT